MKLVNLDDRIHVLNGDTTPASVLQALCESQVQEEPFYLFDVDDLIFKFKQWKLLLPHVKPYYAVKCNDSLVVLEVLAALGAGFSCVSKGEINKVLDLDVDPVKIKFSNPAKPASQIRHANNVGINLTSFDSASELRKIKNYHPNCNLILHFRCNGGDTLSAPGFSYGCEPETEGPQLLNLACELDLQVVGVSFHVGSGCEPSSFRTAIGYARNLFDVGLKLGFNMTVLDIGGGFPGDNNAAFAEIAVVINNSIGQYFPCSDVKVIANPGRYFVSSAFTLATAIYSKREIRSASGDITKVMYYISDGVYGSFSAKLHDDSVFKGVPLNPPNTKLVLSSIWGPTCDSTDKVEENVHLPLLEPGHWLIYNNLGAYSLPVLDPFSETSVPKIHCVSSRGAWMLLKDRLPLTHEHFTGDSTLKDTPRHRTLSLNSQPDALRDESIPDIADMNAYRSVMCRRASVVDQSDISGTSLFYELIQVGPMD